MNQFKPADFCIRVANLAMIETNFRNLKPADPRWHQLCCDFAATTVHAADHCHDAGMDEAWGEIDRINTAAAQYPDEPAAQASAAGHMMTCLIAGLGKRKFLYVSADRTDFVDCDALFGDHVKQSFPSAAFDIREAGNCLAAECHTAAVFHLMRAVEWGLRALGVDLGMRRLRSLVKKTGVVKYTPLPWAQWEEIINQIKSRIAARIATARRGPRKQGLQEFYTPAVDHIERFRDAYRNHVMHTRREYVRTEAFLIFDQVQHFMRRLSTRVTEC